MNARDESPGPADAAGPVATDNPLSLEPRVVVESGSVERGAPPPPTSDNYWRHKSSLVEAIYEEFCARRARGEHVAVDEYRARYPALQSTLGQLLDAHDFTAAQVRQQPPAWPARGETFRGFTLFDELGRGAFSRVFLAAERKVGGRLVAVKLSERFGAAEANILGQLAHRHIVPVHSVTEDEASGLSIVCMPYLGGATLCDVLDRVHGSPRLPERARTILEAVVDVPTPVETPAQSARPFLEKAAYVDGIRFIGAAIAEALAYMHARGFCHRDLKPSNVLMQPDGTPMLLDFNLSTDYKEKIARLGGTIPYMSPEHLLAMDQEGDRVPSMLDARADVFSLGVILFELLTGTHPFGPLPYDVPWQELRKYLLERERSASAPARQANPNIDAPLAALLERCLAHNPNDRPTAAELAAALRRGLTLRRRVQRWIGRRPRLAIATLALVLTLAVALGALIALRPPFAVRQLQHGQDLYRRGDYAAAAQALTEALRAEPGSAAILFERGRAYLRLGETEENYLNLALADLDQADKLAGDGKTKAAVGYCLQRLGNPELAVHRYEQAIKVGFVTAPVLNNLGFAHLGSANLDRAAEALDKAIRLDDTLQAPRFNRALCALRRARTMPAKQPADALCKDTLLVVENGIAHIREAIRLGPAGASLHFDAACLCALATRLGGDWRTAALDHVRLAMHDGAALERFTKDPTFDLLRPDPDFQSLIARPSPSKAPSRTPRLVNPIAD